jgi:hypothetical protein
MSNLKEYKCGYCNYITTNRGNFHSHKKTPKHLKNQESSQNNLLKCHICDGFFEQNNFPTHLQKCSVVNNKIKMLEKENKDLINDSKTSYLKNDELVNENKTLRDKIDNLINENRELSKKNTEYLQNLVYDAGDLVKESFGAIKYLNKKFANAPGLIELDDFSFLDKEKDFVETAVFNFQRSELHKYLGNLLTSECKKENPEGRSFWASDVARLTYIIKQIIDDDISEWISDKQGVELCKFVISPYLHHIKKILLRDISITKKDPSKLKMTESISDIISTINNNSLRDDINRYIAPYFQLHRTEKNKLEYDDPNNKKEPIKKLVNKPIKNSNEKITVKAKKKSKTKE